MEHKPSDDKQTSEDKMSKFRKLYHKPRLKSLGDLRSYTLGASPAGFEDSGEAGHPFTQYNG